MLDYAVKTMCFDAACTKQLFSGRYYSIVLVTRGTARFPAVVIPTDRLPAKTKSAMEFHSAFIVRPEKP